MIINPEGFTAVEWADRLAGEINLSGPNVPTLDSEDEWQPWAARVCEIPFVYGQLPPNPSRYDDWKSWANDFNRAVRY